MPSSSWMRRISSRSCTRTLRVERRERLVEQQHARLDRERAREGDALLHAAGELVRVAVAGVRRGRRARAARRRACAGRRDGAADPQPELDVLRRRHVREERVRLEDHAHVAPVGGDVRDVLAVDDDRARRRGGRSPATSRSAVVLPQPDGPSSERNSPWARSTRRRRRAPAPAESRVEVLELEICHSARLLRSTAARAPRLRPTTSNDEHRDPRDARS